MRIQDDPPPVKPRKPRYCDACKAPIQKGEAFVKWMFWIFCTPWCLPTYLRNRYPEYVNTYGISGDPGVGQ